MEIDHIAHYQKYRDGYIERRKKYSEIHGPEWDKSHKEARRILEASDKDPTKCYECGKVRKTRCHHVDGDGFNNSLDNLEWCCYPCDSKQNSRKYVDKKIIPTDFQQSFQE